MCVKIPSFQPGAGNACWPQENNLSKEKMQTQKDLLEREPDPGGALVFMSDPTQHVLEPRVFAQCSPDVAGDLGQ